VFQLRQRAAGEVEEGRVNQLHRFADVLLKTNRCDLTLPLTDEICDALATVLVNSPVGAVLESEFGQGAGLSELSCLISDPGSQRQVVHPDTPWREEGAVLYTCFVALQDVDLDMGPTVWIPNTHTEDAHAQFKDEQPDGDGDDGESPKDRLLRTAPAVLGMLPAGCCAMYTSQVLHCGTANKSRNGTSRALFYFSFKKPTVGYPGNPGSIRPELVNQLTLGVLMKDLKSFQRGKRCPQLEAISSRMK
jgi:ectoine hydroxylase-related dioxygenase (phytanoyl-CoA dioxygenase family)